MSVLPRIGVATPEQVADAGALTAEAYLADRLLDRDDEYEVELRDAERRAREATLLVASVPVDPAAPDGRHAVVGTITLAPYGSSYAEIAEPGELELRMLAVAPEARGAGVAEALVVAAQREAVVLGARRVVLSTLDSMRTAQRLYARLGFTPAAERDWAHEEIRLRVLTWTPPTAPGVLTEMACWPPLRVLTTRGGWRVGVSQGLTRRANSAVPLTEPADLAAAVAEVVAIYAAERQRPVLRLGGSDVDRRVGELLDAQDWVTASVTDVLVADLHAPVRTEPTAPAPPSLELAVHHVPDDAWLETYLGVKSASADREVARAILAGGTAQHVVARHAGAVVGVIRVAYEGDWAALSCLAVDPLARRAGIGRALTLHALALAREHGAARAFLQVEAHNVVAARLYARLGFRPADSYRYREPRVGALG
ncbi:GNAT family N-acetyltransferase [Cellulomonas gilvus]|uniref:GCN5-related N-acetyltransferase n=1 Tax=Cellulomonas gilvus (strain ATCC 13127 / NRRL B-14078) TaxID=593907 RepID=F8A1W5_CELGA|nr:GNAT family N-acetyltransferase [Cellulomonas gilvus]AEI12909.1 GCN5-related N-acetyltransferase [Cellulomonas gilvus ATCC 13127]